MKLIKDYRYSIVNSGDCCDRRLSVTSRARCESSSPDYYYEVSPIFNIENFTSIDVEVGENIVSNLSFVKQFKVDFENLDYNQLLQEWEELKKTIPNTYKGERVVFKQLPSEDQLKNYVIKNLQDEYTKIVYVYDMGGLFYLFRARKKQKFNFEKAKGQDNLQEFETFIKAHYNINNDDKLILPEGHENSPIQFWIEEYEISEIKRNIYTIEDFTFAREDFMKKMEVKGRQKLIKAFEEALKTKDYYYLLQWKYTAKDLNQEDIYNKRLEELKLILEEDIKKEYKRYIEAINNFKIYKIDEELPEFKKDIEFIDPIYFYTNKEKGKQKREELIKKFGSLFLQAEVAHQKISNLKAIYTKAGYFYMPKDDNNKKWIIEVPDNKKGLFIGKQGKNIKFLENKYNVKIIIK